MLTLFWNICKTKNEKCKIPFYKKVCWFPKQYEKVVIVVVDALRFDFVNPIDDIDNELKDVPFINQLPFITELLTDKPQHSLLYRFEADAPTVTLQRIKGILSFLKNKS